MEFEKLSKLIFAGMKSRLENNQGLATFAKERAKFEGWLKVELCDILSKYFTDITPEKDRIDVTFDNWAIQLKTVNTNIHYPGVKNKHRPITKNVQGVIDDIKKLRSVAYPKKAVLFITFPITHDNTYWQTQFQRISSLLGKVEYWQFSFSNKITGTIYLGLVQ